MLKSETFALHADDTISLTLPTP